MDDKANWVDLSGYGMQAIAVVGPTGRPYYVIRDAAKDMAVDRGVAAHADKLHLLGYRLLDKPGIFLRDAVPGGSFDPDPFIERFPEATRVAFDRGTHFVDLGRDRERPVDGADDAYPHRAFRAPEPAPADPVMERAFEILREDVSRHARKRGPKPWMEGHVVWRASVDRSVAEAVAAGTEVGRDAETYARDGAYAASNIIGDVSRGRIPWGDPARARRMAKALMELQGNETVEMRTRRYNLIGQRKTGGFPLRYRTMSPGVTGTPHLDLTALGIEVVLERGPGDLFSYVARDIARRTPAGRGVRAVARCLAEQGFEEPATVGDRREARLWVPTDRSGHPMTSPDPFHLMHAIGREASLDMSVVKVVPFDPAAHFRDTRPAAEIERRPAMEGNPFEGARALDDMHDVVPDAPAPTP